LKIYHHLILVVLAISAIISAHGQEQAYVWDGRSLQPLYNKQGISCRKWSIWLFASDDHIKVSGQQWGNIVEDSESGTLGQLKDRQEMERQLGYAIDGFTYFNYTGPICNVKPFDSDTNDDLDRLEALGRRLNEVYEKLRTVLPAHKSEILDQLEQLAKTFQRVNQLRNDLVQRQRSGLMTINSKIDEISNTTSILEDKSQQVTSRTPSTGDQNTSAIGTNNWKQQEFSFQGSTMSQNVQIKGKRIKVDQLVVGDPNGQGQSYSFDAQTLDPAAINVSSQGGLWVVSLRSTSRNINLRITDGKGNGMSELVSTVQLYFSSQTIAQAAENSLLQLVR